MLLETTKLKRRKMKYFWMQSDQCILQGYLQSTVHCHYVSEYLLLPFTYSNYRHDRGFYFKCAAINTTGTKTELDLPQASDSLVTCYTSNTHLSSSADCCYLICIR